jgi:G3E family GTPase
MTPPPSRARKKPIPLTLLTGFLGAGKTTLLNRLLRDPAFSGTAVIVNEFGEIGLDHLLVESAADGIIELSSGCVCCSVRGELVDALERLIRAIDNHRIGEVRRVVIETTGLAEPGPILRILLTHPYLRLRFALDGIVTVADAAHGVKTLDEHPQAVKQAAVADRIVMTKADLVDGTADLQTRLASLNPLAEIVDARGAAVATALTGIGSSQRSLTSGFAAEAIDHGHGSVDSLAVARAGCMDESALSAFLERLESEFGDHLLRVKGLVAIAGADGPAVIQGVQGVYSPVARLAGWPDADHRSRLVAIGRNLDRERIERLFDGFLNEARPDTPDRVALTDNPLAIAGFSLRK